MAKYRLGFVSNSSSSSFIISNKQDNINLDDIKDKIAQKVYDDFKEKLVEYKDWYTKNPQWLEHDQKRYGTLEAIKEEFEVYRSTIREFLGTPNMEDVIIADNDDNYFTGEVKEWIEETFDIDNSCWHMGIFVGLFMVYQF